MIQFVSYVKINSNKITTLKTKNNIISDYSKSFDLNKLGNVIKYIWEDILNKNYLILGYQ